MPTYNANALRAATPGLGALAQALVGGNQAFDQGREQAIKYESSIANALAQQRAHDASADLAGAKAASERAELQSRTPDALRNAAMLNSGIPSDEAGTVDAYLKTGKLGSRYDTPAYDGVGPTMPAPDWASKLGTVAAMIGGNQNAIAIGDKNSENVAKARQLDRASALSDAIIAGTQSRNVVAGAQAAMDGKPMYHAGSDGGVLDLFAGSMNTDNPLAKSTIGLRGAQAGAQNASAANSYASAGQHRAATDKLRTETDQIVNAPKGKYDADRGMLIDERAGTARPVLVDGQPMSAKSKSGPMSPALQKELIESDDLVQSAKNSIRTLEDAKKINRDAYSGYGAKTRAAVMSNLPGVSSDSADKTILLDNMMTGQALESLKGIFGGAPTEGERAILLDIQASANKTPKQREEIMDRAISAAKRRAVYATNKASAIRSGKYLGEGYSAPESDVSIDTAPAAAPAAGGWSIQKVGN